MDGLDLIVPAYDPTIIQTFDPLDNDMVAGGFNANEARMQRLLFRFQRPKTTTKVSWMVCAQGAPDNIDVGVYTSPDGGTTHNKVVTLGSTALGAANTRQDANLTVNWQPGLDYWIWVALSNTGGTIGRNLIALSGGSGMLTVGNRCGSKGSSFPLPDPISSPTIPFASGYWIAFWNTGE